MSYVRRKRLLTMSSWACCATLLSRRGVSLSLQPAQPPASPRAPLISCRRTWAMEALWNTRSPAGAHWGLRSARPTSHTAACPHQSTPHPERQRVNDKATGPCRLLHALWHHTHRRTHSMLSGTPRSGRGSTICRQRSSGRSSSGPPLTRAPVSVAGVSYRFYECQSLGMIGSEKERDWVGVLLTGIRGPPCA